MHHQIKNIFVTALCRGKNWEIVHASENFGAVMDFGALIDADHIYYPTPDTIQPDPTGLTGHKQFMHKPLLPLLFPAGMPKACLETDGELRGVLASGKQFYMRWSSRLRQSHDSQLGQLGHDGQPNQSSQKKELAPLLRLVDIALLTDERGDSLFASFPHMNTSKRQQELLFDSMHDGIWLIDNHGITMTVNKAMERIADIHRDDVVGKHVAAAMKDLGFSHCVTLRALEEKQTVTMFDDYANGTRCLNTSTPIFDDDGEVWRVIASIRDITELKKMQDRLAELEAANQQYKDKLKHTDAGHMGLVGNSEPTVALCSDITKAAKSNAVVLVLGETGTGKSLVAQTIHNQSTRKDGPFVSLNCGAIPPTLIESELFGYERGAFTGASSKGKKGVFEQAQGGTLFLDEIAELPLSTQATLLHFLDDLTFRRVGGIRTVQTDVRIVAATNKSLESLVARGEFRADLFYRLRVVVVSIPALRQRPEDVPSLMQHFLNTLEGPMRHRTFSAAMLNALANYAWPGNVRELRGLVQYLHTMCDREMFDMDDLPSHILAGLPKFTHSHSLKEAMEELEKKMLVAALQELKSTHKAAKRLKVSQSTVVRKAQKYKLNLEHYDTLTSDALAHE